MGKICSLLDMRTFLIFFFSSEGYLPSMMIQWQAYLNLHYRWQPVDTILILIHNTYSFLFRPWVTAANQQSLQKTSPWRPFGIPAPPTISDASPSGKKPCTLPNALVTLLKISAWTLSTIGFSTWRTRGSLMSWSFWTTTNLMSTRPTWRKSIAKPGWSFTTFLSVLTIRTTKSCHCFKNLMRAERRSSLTAVVGKADVEGWHALGYARNGVWHHWKRRRSLLIKQSKMAFIVLVMSRNSKSG